MQYQGGRLESECRAVGDWDVPSACQAAARALSASAGKGEPSSERGQSPENARDSGCPGRAAGGDLEALTAPVRF